MNLSAPFIARPVATVLLTLGIVLLGALAYIRLPIAALPTVDRPTIQVGAWLAGASADTIASSVAQPLERQLGTIPGIVEMHSFSAQGGATITIQFELGVDIDQAAGAVQAAINAASPDLPRDLPRPPVYWKANPSGFAVIQLALTSDTIDPGELYDYADSVLGEKLSQIQGVAKVTIGGAQRSAVRVQVDPRLVANMGLSLERVRQAIRSATQNLPKGAVSIGDQTFAIAANDQFTKAADFREVVIAWRNGAAVKLGDVATVSDGSFDTKQESWYGEQPGVTVRVFKQPDANVVETVDAVLAALPGLERWIPPAAKVHVLFDRTLLIRASILDVERTIAIATILVVLVVALFLRRLWATVISSITIPVSLAATLAAMDRLGYSLDNLSLMALTIAVGFVVDDAVIIIENVIRLMQQGETARSAALKSARQLGFTVVSITASLIAALIPILFMPDIVGRYFREFGMTLVVAISASALLSLTLTPMMCAHLLGREAKLPESRESSRFERLFSSFQSFYGNSLDWVLRRRLLAMLVTLALAGGSVGLYVSLPKGFVPTQDTGIIYVRAIAIPNISFAAMQDRQRTVAAAIMGDSAVAGLGSYIGGEGSSLSVGEMVVNLKPLSQRQASIQEIIARLRVKLAKIDDVIVTLQPFQDLALGAQSGSRYQYTMVGLDGEALLRFATSMRQRMRQAKELADVVFDAEISGLQAGQVMDRVRAGRLGITPRALDNTLYDAFGQRQIRWIYLPHNYSGVVLEVDPRFQTDLSAFDKIFVPGDKGAQVPLATLTRPARAHGAMWVHHTDQFPSITLSFDTKPGFSLGQAIGLIRGFEKEIHLPDEIKAGFRGEAGEASKSATQQGLLFLGALFAIYVVLGVLYESYAHPLTILSTLPSATFGALAALALSRTEFSLFSAIACILLVGMVMKNAIMMVDFALDSERSRNLAPRDAIREAARLRLRPIVMTSAAAILSAVPLALGTGPGHELRQPLGIAIVGGLLVSQILTLYTVPVIYLLIDRLRRSRESAPFLAPVGLGD